MRFVLLMAAFCFTVSPLRSEEMIFKSKESKATLIELYSSEGCSSCPPAEAWMSKLKDSPALWVSLYPVVFHVDYWDGLGWPDRFARPDFTQRQRRYAELLGQDSVYTPEFITNGREWRGWFQGDQIPPARSVSRGELTLTVDVDARKVSAIFLPQSESTSQSYTVHVALLGFNVTTDVKRGENGGRVLQHDFVVLDFLSKVLISNPDQKLQSGLLDFSIPTTNRPGAVVAWVLGPDGSIVQMTGGWLKPPAR